MGRSKDTLYKAEHKNMAILKPPKSTKRKMKEFFQAVSSKIGSKDFSVGGFKRKKKSMSDTEETFSSEEDLALDNLLRHRSLFLNFVDNLLYPYSFTDPQNVYHEIFEKPKALKSDLCDESEVEKVILKNETLISNNSSIVSLNQKSSVSSSLNDLLSYDDSESNSTVQEVNRNMKPLLVFGLLTVVASVSILVFLFYIIK